MTLPAHKPTKITREKVFDFKSFGVTNEEIANYLEISPDTLTKYYKEELKNAALEATAEIAKSLFRNAKEGDVASQIFWLKTRGRWRTADNQQIIESNENLTQELKELRAKLDAQNKREY